MKITSSSLLALVPLAAAHFELNSPTPRGVNEDQMSSFPCGGSDTPSAERSSFPLTDGSVTVDLGHTVTNLEVLIAIGNNPGSAFNTILRRPFLATGLGPLCINQLSIPTSLNITSGTNATIQVQSNGDPSGGLYACADVTLVARNEGATVRDCTAGNIQIGAPEVSGHPNGTAFDAAASAGSGSATQSPSSSATAASTSASSTPNSGAGAVGAGLGGVVLAAAGALAMVL